MMKTDLPKERLTCTVKEAAELLNVSVSTVRKKIYQGEIPTLEGFGDRHIIPYAWIKQIVDESFNKANRKIRAMAEAWL
ncbi:MULTISPECIES: helix-turn-helix domain-containing protein [Dehalococcoides]|jgi:excisionase family DNA binding protein|uniref:Helix-turn-helix domain-containing protein n=1 Tax=Dehalococcoides mccartyi TaxID=61435 RepID=A0A142VBN8_9CHLR|nr:helix-turn-helix domain-containing protein [Dehalococcoides mccartyi]AGG07949.1 hypothetical protein btf_862 [Dehalococcoides mccartyi BTF08]AMU86645.1 hypothetical protein Dm11a5_0819 [Dehalococcoides mccartyi]